LTVWLKFLGDLRDCRRYLSHAWRSRLAPRVNIRSINGCEEPCRSPIYPMFCDAPDSFLKLLLKNINQSD
jgi:hypothetical protein